jgi:hypothetical protein
MTYRVEPVPEERDQYKLTILNPASVLADTDDVIVPSVLLTAVPPAFQFQPTYV